jgi:DNA-binding transcriptional ArsR family regulator
MTMVTTVFRALADPTRLAVFERIAGGEISVNELKAGFDVSQPAISQHLAALRSAGLVTERREGRQVFYRIEPAGLVPLADWLGHYQRFWNTKLGRMKKLLQEMDDDPR